MTLSTLLTVSQWPLRLSRPSAAYCIDKRINPIHSEAGKLISCTRGEISRECADCKRINIRRKVHALWRMEKYGVRLGWKTPCLSMEIEMAIEKFPIVKVGMGAGLVAAVGFETWICNDPWKAEGVGHMLALQHHPTIAWLLGMPKVKASYIQFTETLAPEIVDRVNFGNDRMMYLCGDKIAKSYMLRDGNPAAEFAAWMTSYGRCEHVPPLPGEVMAREFTEETWATK